MLPQFTFPEFNCRQHVLYQNASILFLKKYVVYYDNLTKRDFFSEFIFVISSYLKNLAELIFTISSYQTKFAEFNFTTLEQNRKNKCLENIFRKNFFRKYFFP